MNRYDAILSLIPIALGVGATAALVSKSAAAVLVGAIVAVGAIGYGMFVIPPTDLSALHPKE